MSIVDFALAHARAGFTVFPAVPDGKIPNVPDPYANATRNEKSIENMWSNSPYQNICLPCGIEFEPGKYLFAVDVDNKDKDGFKTMEDLETLGFEFPKTLTQQTPTGGLHLLYWTKKPLKNSVGGLGLGIDTRGFHGYVIGAGSVINGKAYTIKEKSPIVEAPLWIIEKCQSANPKATSEQRRLSLVHNVNEETANKRAIAYLENLEVVTAGNRNHEGFKVASKLKDFGLPPETIRNFLIADWKCEPPLAEGEISSLVTSAFRYGANAPAIDTPEFAFNTPPTINPGPAEPTSPTAAGPFLSGSPFDEVNKEYFYAVVGGVSKICRETTDHFGQKTLERMSVPTFHEKLASKVIYQGDGKPASLTRLWMASKDRRSYDGIVFSPNRDCGSYYNIWRGFAVLPSSKNEQPHPKAQAALDSFIEHVYKNVVEENEEHFNWVMGFFSHIFQRPEEKPLVALVLKGGKGVGKNALIDCVGRLLGQHFVTVSDRRYLVGNFNSLLENKLLFALDEAFWSGEKGLEGILKALITSETKTIEHKGSEPYVIRSSERVVIMGNDEWIAPASHDERRYAVFKVGDGRKQDQKFFVDMREGMEKFGGSELLLRYFLDFDLSKVNVSVAPHTKELNVQKEKSLNPIEQWWLGCLEQGYISHSGIEDWPKEVGSTALREAFSRSMKDINTRSRLPGDKEWGINFRKMAPSSYPSKIKWIDGAAHRVYELAPLEEARNDWRKAFGMNWEFGVY